MYKLVGALVALFLCLPFVEDSRATSTSCLGTYNVVDLWPRDEFRLTVHINCGDPDGYRLYLSDGFGLDVERVLEESDGPRFGTSVFSISEWEYKTTKVILKGN